MHVLWITIDDTLNQICDCRFYGLKDDQELAKVAKGWFSVSHDAQLDMYDTSVPDNVVIAFPQTIDVTRT